MSKKPGRNAPCPCGSGLKYKKCCSARDATVDTSVHDGYQHVMNGDSARACDRWADAWNVLRPRLSPQMRTTAAAAAVFVESQPLFDWIQDFALELSNAALHDAFYAQAGIDLCRHVLAQFPDESLLFRLNFRADLGQFFFLADRYEHGEQILAELICEYPDQALGYVRLADLLGSGVRSGDPPIDLLRAIALLEAALARPVADAPDYDLAARLADLREHTSRSSPPATALPPHAAD